MEKRTLVLLEFFKQLSLIKRIVIGIVVGAVLGIFLPQWSFIAILGSLFVGALKGIAPLLVFVLIMSSVSKHQANTQTFIKPIISLYLFTTLLAATVAVLASYIFL